MVKSVEKVWLREWWVGVVKSEPLVTEQSGPFLCKENMTHHTNPPVSTSHGAKEDPSEGAVLVWRL